MVKKTELVQSGGALANPLGDVPDFMREYGGLGTETLTSAAHEIPRLKLLQALSPEIQEFDDAKAGQYWHSIAETQLGNNITIVPIWIDQRYILWNPREAGGGILARADDGKHWSPPNQSFKVSLKSGSTVEWKTAPTVAQSRLDQWGTYDPNNPKSLPAATFMLNMVCGLPDFSGLEPIVLTGQRTSLKPSKKLASKLAMIRAAPSFGIKVKLGTQWIDEGADRKYWNFTFTLDGFIKDPDMFNKYRELYEFFKDRGYGVKDVSDLQESDIPESDGAGEGKPSY